MRFGGIALLLLVGAALIGAGSAAAANPVTVQLTAQPVSGSSTQRCITVAINDTVTNQPLAADVQLSVRYGPLTSLSLQAKTDFNGRGTFCLEQSIIGGAATASVSVPQGTVLVHSSPEYQTTGSGNTVTLSWASGGTGAAGGQFTIAPVAQATSIVAGSADVVDVKLGYSGPTAFAPSLEIAFSGDVPTVVSATSDSGTCTGSPLTCSFSDIGNGGQANVELRLQATTPGSIAIAFTAHWRTSTGFGGQSLPGSSTGSLTVAVANPIADLGLSLTAAKPKLAVGKRSIFTALVRNAGPQPAPGTTLTFGLPKSLKLARLAGTGVSCVTATRRCTIATLGTSGPLRVSATVIPTKPGPVKVTAKVAVSGPTDPAAANNAAVLTLVVPAAPRHA